MPGQNTIRAILRAARHVCEQQFDKAASGEVSRVHVFVATLVLESAYAYLRIYMPPETEDSDELHIRSETRAVELKSPGCSCSADRYGPN